MLCRGDRGHGKLKVYLGSDSNWSEDNLAISNAPAKGRRLGQLNTTYKTGTVYTWDLTGGITGNGTYTLILDQAANANDAWFSSREGEYVPRLNIEW